MIIESSNILVSAGSTLVSSGESTEGMRALVGKAPVAGAAQITDRFSIPAPNMPEAVSGAISVRTAERVELTSEALALLASLPKKLGAEEVEQEQSMDVDPIVNLYTYKLLIEAMTGRKIKIMDPHKPDLEEDEVKGTELQKREEEDETAGIEYHYKEVFIEAESLLFAARGVIRTASGVERGFNIKLRMERSFYSERSFDFAAGDGVAVDPLIINFASGGTALRAEKELFDLNSDGSTESISMPEPGSGFLVYDNNRGGAANNGTEVVGSNSGNRFAELPAYDYWIDENDPIYNSLRVLVEGPNGEDTLVSLNEVGIGAIYLKYADIELSIKDSANNTDAQVRRGSVYLNERYAGGTVQKVDFVV